MTPILSPAICTLLWFTALTLILPLLYAGYRSLIVVAGKAKANAWTRGAQAWQDPALVVRMQHAHLNCVENLPLYAAVVLAAYATNQLPLVDHLACIFLALRLGQTGIHLISASHSFVFIRASLWMGQIGILLYLILKLCGKI